MRFPKLRELGAVIAGVFLVGQAAGTPHFGECVTEDGGYRVRVLEIMREAWPKEIDPLVVRYAVSLWAERGVGLFRDASGYYIVRLEFDESLFYSAYRDDYERQDFENTDVRVASISVPISDALAVELLGVFEDIRPATPGQPSTSIVVDGSTTEVFQAGKPCARFSGLPADPAAKVRRISELVSFLGDEIVNWRRITKDDFEVEAMRLIAAIEASQ